jgi:hypothetical protein
LRPGFPETGQQLAEFTKSQSFSLTGKWLRSFEISHANPVKKNTAEEVCVSPPFKGNNRSPKDQRGVCLSSFALSSHELTAVQPEMSLLSANPRSTNSAYLAAS